jgi:hypothetical protein
MRQLFSHATPPNCIATPTPATRATTLPLHRPGVTPRPRWPLARPTRLVWCSSLIGEVTPKWDGQVLFEKLWYENQLGTRLRREFRVPNYLKCRGDTPLRPLESFR